MSTYTRGVKGRTPEIHNVTMTVADTEYSQELPYRCLKYLIHTRDESEFRLAFETGIVAVPAGEYFTVPQGTRYWEDGVNNENVAGSLTTLYFASDSAGKVIEIIVWT